MIIVDKLTVANRIESVSFSISPGEKLHLLGPNGSGKSTLLASIAGSLRAQGTVLIDGQSLLDFSIEQQSCFRGYLAQADYPSFHIFVYQYLLLSKPQHLSADDPKLQDVVGYLIERLSLQDKLDKSIRHLSGGEWQRVRLAGICLQVWPSLNGEAKLLLLDEPASALDISQEKLLFDLVDELAQQGIAVIMANHDMNRALHHADKVMLFKHGKAEKFGSVNQVLTEENILEVFDTRIKMIEFNNQSHILFD